MMRESLKRIAIFSLIVFAVLAKSHAQYSELQPFDALGRENVTVKARQIAGGSALKRNWESGYGSYDRDKSSFHEIQAEISSVGARPGPIELAFYYVLKNRGTKDETVIFSDLAKFQTGSGIVTFSSEAQSNEARYVYLQERFKSGESVAGWFVRAIRDGKIVGYAASTDRMKTYAISANTFGALRK